MFRGPSSARELQQAARRSQPVANSALMAGAALTILQLDDENDRLRFENARLRALVDDEA
jgi:hypothetical protein